MYVFLKNNFCDRITSMVISMKEKKDMKLVVFCLLIIFSVVLGYILINFIYQEYALRKEINNLSKLDITMDKFDTKLVSHGNYLKVEKAIKNYLNEYSINLQNINKLVDEESFRNLISYKALQSKDNFSSEIKNVEETKKRFNFYINNLLKMCDEKSIKQNIKNYTNNIYFKNLYNDLMLDKSVLSKLNLSTEYLEDYSKNINSKFDTCLEIYSFLIANKDNWKVEEGEIRFATEELINNYNSLIEKIK